MQITSFDGKNIQVRVWDAVKDSKGTVQIVHGMAEHSGLYEAFAEELNELGYVVYADDHRGHGYTDSDTLGYAKGDMFADTVKDEALIAKTIKEKYPDVKHILLGHSYGSFISQAFLSEYSSLIDGAILYGSNYKKDAETRFGVILAQCGKIFKGENAPAQFMEKLTFGAYMKKFDDRLWLSTNREYNRKYYSDPMCGFTCSYNFYYSLLKNLNKLYTDSYAAGLDKELPLMIVSGKDDPVGDMGRGVKRLYRYYRGVGMKNLKPHLIPGARHVLLGEKEEYRADFVKSVFEFIEKVEKR